MSKYLFFENSLLDDAFINLPFSILPIKLKLSRGIKDLVIKFFSLIFTSLLKFFKKFFLILALILSINMSVKCLKNYKYFFLEINFKIIIFFIFIKSFYVYFD